MAADGDEIHHTVVSELEASVIAGAGVSGGEEPFLTEQNSKAFIQGVGSLFPDHLEYVVEAFPLKGRHLSLAVDCFKRCAFLGSGGCLLPDNKKPLFCRIYPFWFVKGKLVTFNNNRCLALLKTSDINELMDMFKVDEKNLRELYAEIVFLWLGKTIPGSGK